MSTVSQASLPKETVKVRLEGQPEIPKRFHNCEIRVARNGKRKLPEGYVPPPPEELAELRKITPVEEPHSLVGSVGAALSGLGVAPAEPEKPAREGERHSCNRGRRGRGGSRPSAEPITKEPVEEGRQAQPPRQKQKGEQQCPPRPGKQPKAPATPPPTSDKTAAPPTGEKKRPHRRHYRDKPEGDRPQGPRPES